METLFAPELRIPLFKKIEKSHSSRYVVESSQDRIKFTNIIVNRLAVTETDSHKTILEIDHQREPSHFWFSWTRGQNNRDILLTRSPDPEKHGATMYLFPTEVAKERSESKEEISAEKPEGDLKEKSKENPKGDPKENPKGDPKEKPYKEVVIPTSFEWREARVSPDGSKLALVCDRASSKPIRVFDFRNPETVPYPELKISPFPAIDKMNPYRAEIEWKNDVTLKASVPVYCRDELSLGHDYYCQEFTLNVKEPHY